MAFVLDASVACAWVFADKATPALEDLLDRVVAEEVFVPALWCSEVMNTLVQASRRNRISSDQVTEYWSYLEGLGIRESSYTPPIDQIVNLCQKHGLTAYDAHYLALAVWLNAPIATLDTQLTDAAHMEGLNVLGTSNIVDA